MQYLWGKYVVALFKYQIGQLKKLRISIYSIRDQPRGIQLMIS